MPMSAWLTQILKASEPFLFVGLPYAALVIFFVGTVQRYRQRTYTYSSLSSQFLENRHHFWSSVPFHYGVILVLSAHVLVFLAPARFLVVFGTPVRLWALEVTGLALGLMTLVGLGNIVLRRILSSKCRVATTRTDWGLLGLLVIQVGSGVSIALVHGWGSAWFAASVAPYLWSIALFRPDTRFVTPLPWLVKLHVVNAFLLIGFVPFTRLVHILVVPNPYLWRKTQVVRWNWNRAEIRRIDR